jgi:hypothetical protein
MSMHLVGPHMTTTNTKKRKSGKKSKRQQQADAAHANFLKRMGVGKVKADSGNKIPNYKTISSNTVPTSDAICANGSKKDRNVYNGERQLIGIATMHKSNMVPIFADKKDDAKDIAKMGR